MTTRVYLGRLSRDARERDVERLFKGYGDIREVNIKNGFGFVEFRDHKDAEDVVYDFHGKEFLGERIIVELARGDRRRGERRSDDRRRDERYGPSSRTQYRLVVEGLASGTSWQRHLRRIIWPPASLVIPLVPTSLSPSLRSLAPSRFVWKWPPPSCFWATSYFLGVGRQLWDYRDILHGWCSSVRVARASSENSISAS
ncbi:hypothetical protein BC936DRAFT_145314 [Jimgerdemannia flammicorona]|uniref:RRM domain-containing protein n=1 Tax=Jimgerdemannia flammicorona TaxID=994334 RepID=A0A433DAA7_9FUNG|nr:hypothetical protein BC936DRAFT_145314 [Jimgerdemannia flammicorona]